MSPPRSKLPSQSAALAGVPAGVQAAGPWAGRRQLFVRFADEAETATIYSAEALQVELRRLAERSRYHSIAIGGRDPLGESAFLAATLAAGVPLPVMLDHDGQRPEALEPLLPSVQLVQVGLDGCESEAAMERVCDSLRVAAARRVRQAVAIVPAESASDARLLRIVEQVHGASGDVCVVVHPTSEGFAGRDRRWTVWLERATSVHGDVRLLPRIPRPTGMR